MKILDANYESSCLYSPLVELIQSVGFGCSSPAVSNLSTTGTLRRTGSLGSSAMKLFEKDCDEEKLSHEILAEILNMAQEVVDYLKSSDYWDYNHKHLGISILQGVDASEQPNIE